MKLILGWVLTNAVATAVGVIGGLAAAIAAYAVIAKIGILGIVLALGLYPIAGFVLGAAAGAGQHLILSRYFPISGIRWIAKSGSASAVILMPAFIIGSYVIAPIGFLFPDALRAPLSGRLLVGFHFAVIGAVMGAALGWAQRTEFRRVGIDATRWAYISALGAALGCALILGGTAFVPQEAVGRGVGALLASGPIFGLVGATAGLVTGTYLKRLSAQQRTIG